MVTEEFNPNVGKDIFAQHQADLECGLAQVAQALSGDYATITGFFRKFLDGFWNPFEEVCETANEGQEEITKAIISLEKRLRSGMPFELHQDFERYSDLLVERNTSTLNYAFLVGYQCAIRFLMMGLFPAAKVLPGEEVSE